MSGDRAVYVATTHKVVVEDIGYYEGDFCKLVEWLESTNSGAVLYSSNDMSHVELDRLVLKELLDSGEVGKEDPFWESMVSDFIKLGDPDNYYIVVELD